MLIAKEKIKSNITEYLIYMFQIENLIRACRFDNQLIEEKLVSQYKVDEPTRLEIKSWYFGLKELMIEEQIENEGHLQFLVNKMNELYDFHLFLLQSDDHPDYKQLFKRTEKALNSFISVTPELNNPIRSAIENLYRISVLKMTGREVSPNMLLAAGKAGALLQLLSKKFAEYEKGELTIE